MSVTLATSPPSYAVSAVQIEQYIAVACLMLCVWDWLLTLSDEFEMMRPGARNSSHILYILYLIVRICPIIYLVASINNLAEAAAGNQQILLRIMSVVGILIMPANSALFFLRVRAIYIGNKYVTIFFGSCLLGILVFFAYQSVVGLTICLGSGASSTRCYKSRYINAWAYIATAVYDTLMYLSISWRLASFSTSNTWQASFKSFFTGDGLGWLSKVLLQSGQLYYFVTIGFTLCSIIFLYTPSEHKGFTCAFIPPNITCASVMACRLVRELKLGLFVGPMTELEGAMSQLVLRDMADIERHGISFEQRGFDDVDKDTGAGETSRKATCSSGRK